MNIQIDAYKHFSFDLWLTLIKSNPQFKINRNRLLRDFFSIDSSIEKIGETVRYYDLLANRISESTGIHFDANHIYYLILDQFKISFNQSDKQLQEFQKEVDTLFFKYKPILIDGHIKDLFKKISNQNKTISLLSNTAFITGESLRKILMDYELSDYFMFQLYSDEIGISKPNHSVFDMVFNKVNDHLRITKSEVVHIGDNKFADYLGAKNYGFQAILI
ncbi:HAD family hydrolase [Sphingobacterium sp. PCS056]|uniref:HAD family hydrolase n=1 Tax=Sphingobacterium sp. PCS056 TaxID=2931400 RepID=UPI00200BE32C|nr:HAD family hydrolase [Sphingobacterium sp. PCS056]UPZ35865.1 HAD family hydrolase [Sphingobacterium sp. PCS056]